MELTAEQVNKFLADAVLNSQLGEIVKQAVARVVEDLSKSYKNPFDEVIKRYISELIEQEVRKSYAPVLKQKIETAVAQWTTDEVLNKIIDAGLERLRSRY